MASSRYVDRVAIITGGSSGIGKGCAHEFVRAGAKVVICCNNEREGTAVAGDLRALAREQGAGDISFVYCDVRSAEDLRRLVEATLALHGRLDEAAYVFGLPHVAVDEESLAATLPACQFLQATRDGRPLLLVVAAEHDLRARANELIGAALADAAAPAGDDHHLIGIP